MVKDFWGKIWSLNFGGKGEGDEGSEINLNK